MREVIGRRAAARVRTIRGAAKASSGFEALVGESPVMRAVIDRLRRIAGRDANLLLEGASGTGKELAAQAVHSASERREGPFVVVDCRANPGSLVEGDPFQSAHGGTLFLDEVGELELTLQCRLLRLFDRRRSTPAGAPLRKEADVRIIAATSLDLCREAANGRFRTDLYYRLAVNCIRMPSLAERLEDIPLLWRHFCRQLGDKEGLEEELDEATTQRLARRPWPGNVRELRNIVERMVTLGAEALETPAPSVITPPGLPATESFHAAKATLLASFEREFLTQVLARHAGNITASASSAGVDRVHFLRLLDRYGLRKTRAG